MRLIIALLAGLLFGIGLTISQMVNPDKVLSFLDVTGDWDASLLLVMGSAFCVFSLSFWLLIKKRRLSILGEPISLPTNKLINKPLVIGAVLFGLGWGISGICPGPAVANISGGEPKILTFIVVMIIGMRLSEWFKKRI